MVVKYLHTETASTPVKKAAKKKVLKKLPTKATTTVQYPEKSVVQTNEVVSQTVFSEPTCNVGVQAGMTINVGNYNSVKVGVTLNMPCLEKDIDATFDKASQWVDAKMNKLQDAVLESTDKKEGEAPF